MAIRWVTCIIEKDGNVLLAKLRKKNDFIVRLQWTFPFTMLKEEESPRKAVQRLFDSIKLDVKTGRFLVRFVPSENPKVEQMFYEAKYVSGIPLRSDDYSEFVWIKPTQVLKYLTTSISSDVMDYLRSLEETGKGMIIE